MNCPVCGSELPSGVRYCPVCGTDVEGALMRSQQQAAARNVPPTQQMPAQQQAPMYASAPQQAPRYNQQYAPQYAQQGRAVPLNSSMPRQGQPMGREVDMSQMGGSPKWPIVLIAVLAVLIVVVVLLIFRPWDAGQGNVTPGVDPQGNVAVQPNEGQTSQEQQGTTPPVSDGAQQPSQGATVTDPAAPSVDPAVAANEALYQSLTSYYGELAGLDSQISATATDFNNYYTSGDVGVRQAYASSAATLYATITTSLNELNAMVVAVDSPYYNTWQNMITLYGCLSNRIRVISEAWNLAVVNPNDPQISVILSADNVGGVNKYKTQYQELYPSAQPVQA